MRPTPIRRKAVVVLLCAFLLSPLAGLLAVGVQAPAGAPPQPLSHPEYPLGSWRMFQANPEHTGQALTSLPPGGHVVWRHNEPTVDTSEGGAVVEGGVAYVVLGREMMALNASTGQRIWNHTLTSRSVSTPALWNGTVYVGSDAGFSAPNFYALDAATGATRWIANETPPSLGGGVQLVWTSPSIADGVVYYGSFTYWFYARDAANGSLLWSADLGSEVRASPAVADGIVYVATAGIHEPVLPTWIVTPRLFAFNAITGSEVWNQSVPQGHLYASPVASDGVVYAATAGFSYSAVNVNAGYVLAFNATTGSPLWTSPDVGRMLATPAVSGAVMYVAGAGRWEDGATSTDARLRKLDLAASGAVLWEKGVGNAASIYAPPVVGPTFVVVAARDGTVLVSLHSNATLWSFSLGAEVTAPLAVVGEMIFVHALDGYLHAFGAQPDFEVTPSDITLSDPTPHAEQPLVLTVIVHNRGDKKGSAEVAAELNVSGTATPIASWTLSDVPLFSDSGPLTAPLRFASGGPVNISVRVTNATPEDGDPANDAATMTTVVLPATEGWRARWADERGSNFLETATPQNNIVRWELGAFGAEGNGFLAYDSTLLFAQNGSNLLLAMNPANGYDVLWTWSAPAAIVGTPAVTAGVVVVATANASDAAGNVSFLDADSGALLGQAALPGRPTTAGVPFGDRVLWGVSDRLVELSIANLTVERELPVVDVPPTDRPAVRTEPVVVNGWAFLVSSTGELHAFNLTLGAEPPGWPVQLQGPTAIAPAVGSGFLFVVNGSTSLSAFPLSPLSPAPAWTASFAEPISGALAAGYGRVFVPTPSNASALVAGSGALVWNRSMVPLQPANAIRAAGNDTVFVGSERLFALSSSTGDVVWTFEPESRGAVVGPAALHRGALHLQTSLGGVVTLGLVPGLPPTAVLASPIDGRTYRTREPVTFSADGTFDPDNQNLTYLWDFGDGAMGNASTEAHTYTFAGEFDVRLTVTDEQGLSATRAVHIRVIENQAPSLFAPADRLRPSEVGLHLDTTVWTFRVRYIDPDGDPPTAITLAVTNESQPVKALLPEAAGPYDFATGVNYSWTGTLESGTHAYAFLASDGLDNASTPLFAPFNVFRIEAGASTTFSFEVEYVGKGTSAILPPTGVLLPPPGFAAIDKFNLELPANASNVQWVVLRCRYSIAVNVSDFIESTISLYWYDQSEFEWVPVPSTVDPLNATVEANLTVQNPFAGGLAIFGAFGRPSVPAQNPVAHITVRDGRSVVAPREVIEFSAAGSVETNDGNFSNLTFLWDFGDGNVSAGVLVNHSYEAEGNYEVRLTVINGYGLSASAFHQVTVRTQAATSTFLWIAAAIVGLLLITFALWPVFRRRGRPAAGAPERRAGRPPGRPPGKGTPPKSAGQAAQRGGKRPPSPEEEETQLLDELQGDFEKGVGPKGGA